MIARINNSGELDFCREEKNGWISAICPFKEGKFCTTCCPLMEEFDKIFVLRCGGTPVVFEKEVVKK